MTRTALRLSLMASIAALAAGCAGAWNGRDQAMTVAEEHPISVDSQTVTLTIDLDRSTKELTSVDKARLRAFADSYLTNGHGPLTVTAPSGTSDDFDGQETASDVRKYLNEIGVPWSDITGSSYRAADDRGTKLIVSYTHYVATPSACGVWAGVKARDYANMHTPNFGCATQNNIAAMLADPHDLIAPADETPPDSTARIRGVQAYREGAVTVSETDNNIKSQIAE
ncbi:MAG TPA: CpaD family pilus assembly protein [Parvularculaceae bacterium]|nr:CpaD family pilus assembly protein [Parvularculaceae bacterium]